MEPAEEENYMIEENQTEESTTIGESEVTDTIEQEENGEIVEADGEAVEEDGDDDDETYETQTGEIDETGGWRSSTLLKVTQARICDMKSLDERKNQIKPEDDPWWNVRNPKIYEKKSLRYTDVQSRLNKSTKAWECGRRDKVVETKTTPGTFSTDPNVSTRRINGDSPLLKPTKESLQSSWHGSSQRLSIDRPKEYYVQSPKLLAKVKGTGPKKVESKLTVQTKGLLNARWKSKEDMKKEKEEELAARKAGTPKVTAPSPTLTRYNASMKAAKKEKMVYSEGDLRENGWQKYGMTAARIPDIDMAVPYRNSRDSVKSRDDNSPPKRKENESKTKDEVPSADDPAEEAEAAEE